MQVGCRDDRAAPAGDGHTPAGVQPTHLGRPPSSTYPCPSEYPLVRCGSPRTPSASPVQSSQVSRRFPSTGRSFERPVPPRVTAAGALALLSPQLHAAAVVVSIAAPLRALEYNAIPRRSALCRSSAPRWYNFAQVSGPDMQLRDPSSRYAFMCASLVHCVATQSRMVATQRNTAATTPSHCTALRDASSSRAFLCASACHEARHGRRAPRALRVRRRAFVRATADCGAGRCARLISVM